MRTILLLSGPIAVGKTAVAQELVDHHKFGIIKSSSYLRSQCARLGIEEDRRSLQELGDKLDRDTDYRWLIENVARATIYNSVSTQRWLLDSVRKYKQVEHFRNEFGEGVRHVHLHAPEEVLRSRYQNRMSGLTDRTTYEMATKHPNEIEARNLISIADLTIDLTSIRPSEVTQQIVRAIT